MSTKLTLTQVIKEYQETENYFDQGRIIFGLHDRRMEYYDRKEEIKRVNSYCKAVLIHLIMSILPDPRYLNAVEKNMNDLINRWMIPSHEAIMKANMTSIHLNTEFGYNEWNQIAKSLKYDHDYQRHIISQDEMEALYVEYIHQLCRLRSLNKILNKKPTKESMIEVLEKVKEFAKELHLTS